MTRTTQPEAVAGLREKKARIVACQTYTSGDKCCPDAVWDRLSKQSRERAYETVDLLDRLTDANPQQEARECECDPSWSTYRCAVCKEREAAYGEELNAPKQEGASLPAGGEGLRDACQRMADDYQVSSNHHPNHVLVNLADFDEMRRALAEPQMFDNGEKRDIAPLEWSEIGQLCGWAAPRIGTTYSIQEFGSWTENPFQLIVREANDANTDVHHFLTLDEAKAFAQSDFELRVSSALRPAGDYEDRLQTALTHLKAMSHVAPRSFEVEAAFAFLAEEEARQLTGAKG